MRVKTVLVSILFFASIAVAQNTFQKTFGGLNGDIGNSILQTQDGGVLVAGVTYSFGYLTGNVLLLKTGPAGDTLWAKSIGGTGEDWALNVNSTSDSGFVITGYCPDAAGLYDLFLYRVNCSGDTLWTRTYGGNGIEDGHSVQETSDGGFIVTGHTASFGAGGGDLYLVRTGSAGDSVWTRAYGGTGYDWGNTVQQTMDGGFIVTGATPGSGAGGYDVYLLKINPAGDTIWTRTYGGSGNDMGAAGLETSDDGFIIAGVTESFGSGSADVYLIKTDSLGNLVWSKTYGGTKSDEGNSLYVCKDGGFIIGGRTFSFGGGGADALLLKTDSSGELVWAKTFGGAAADLCYSVQQNDSSGYILAGYTMSFGTGLDDVFIIKTDSQGNSGNCNETDPSVIQNQSATVQNYSSTIITVPSNHLPSLPVFTEEVYPAVNDLCQVVGVKGIIEKEPEIPEPAILMQVHRPGLLQDVKIYNTLGQEVHPDHYSFKQAKGIYMLRIVSDNHTVTRKIMMK